MRPRIHPPSKTPKGKVKTVGPHSSPAVLKRIDHRTLAGRHIRRVQRELRAHLGNRELTYIEKQIIERASYLSLHIALQDQRALDGKKWTQIDANSYITWTNTFQKTLMRLDPALVARPADDAPTLQDYLANRAEAAADAGHDAAPLRQDAHQGGAA